MEKNDIVEIEITGMTDDGSGVGRFGGAAVFVPYALVGETVRAHIIKVYKSYSVGKLVEIIKPSESRLKADCEYFYQCGGCAFRNTLYEEELKYKQQHIKDCLERIGKIQTEVLPVIGGERTAYRNKAQFPVDSGGAGLYARHSHRIVKTQSCLIQNEDSVKILQIVRAFMSEYNVEGYDEKTHSGVIRNVYTRSGGGKTIVCIVTKAEEIPHCTEMVDMLRASGVPLWGIVQNINPNRTNVVLGKQMKLLYGQNFMYDNIGDLRFKISPFSFYQVNPKQTKTLYDTVKKFLGDVSEKTVWDLYCGIGTIGQYAARNAKKLVGIEIVPEAVENAIENARINGIKNAEYYAGAAEKLADGLVKKEGRPAAVILDPPRKGCDKRLLDAVAKVKPEKIIYVSCKASTLARDLAYLEASGYKTQIVQPVDMFPATPHVECCVLLCST